jgi:hypothetical protein
MCTLFGVADVNDCDVCGLSVEGEPAVRAVPMATVSDLGSADGPVTEGLERVVLHRRCWPGNSARYRLVS